jgi:carbon storage regulator CsrA
MLCLSVKVGHKVQLNTSDGPIVVVVNAIKSGSQVQLAIQAPTEVPIYRQEVMERMQQERKYGAQGVLVGGA